MDLSPDRLADKYLGLGMGMGQERKQAGDSICCRKFLNHLKDDDELMQSARTLYTYILFLPSPPAGSLSPPLFYPSCSYPADSAPPPSPSAESALPYSCPIQLKLYPC